MWNNPSLLNRIANFIFSIIAFTLVVASSFHISQLQTFEIDTIMVEGDMHSETIEKISSVSLDGLSRNFFKINLQKMKELLERLPRVRAVEIVRRWPDRLDIFVFEHTPVALWGDDGFISEDGTVINASVEESAASVLPVFDGPELMAGEILGIYWDGNNILDAVEKHIVGVFVDDRFTWEIQLDNGHILRLGREKKLQRITRFTVVFDIVLSELGDNIEYIDMRYEDGFAIGVKG